jgi:hypothetical protein
MLVVLYNVWYITIMAGKLGSWDAGTPGGLVACRIESF